MMMIMAIRKSTGVCNGIIGRRSRSGRRGQFTRRIAEISCWHKLHRCSRLHTKWIDSIISVTRRSVLLSFFLRIFL